MPQDKLRRVSPAAETGDVSPSFKRTFVLPGVVFTMQGIETLLCYGKRLFGERAGITIHDRAPAMRPTALGIEMTRRYAAAMGGFS